MAAKPAPVLKNNATEQRGSLLVIFAGNTGKNELVITNRKAGGYVVSLNGVATEFPGIDSVSYTAENAGATEHVVRNDSDCAFYFTGGPGVSTLYLGKNYDTVTGGSGPLYVTARQGYSEIDPMGPLTIKRDAVPVDGAWPGGVWGYRRDTVLPPNVDGIALRNAG